MADESDDDIRVTLIAELNKSFKTSDPKTISLAIGRAVREFNISRLAKESGLERPSIYRAFAGEQLPNFTTVLAVLNAMGLRLKVGPSRSRSWRSNLAREPKRRQS